MSGPRIDPHFVLGPSLQEFFIDKGNNLPLTNGLVFFYHDNARNILKPVYELVADPVTPNVYNFVELPDPIVLSGAGTIQDPSGNDILPYYFPFTGTPDDPGDEIDLYYIVVTDQFGIPQFTRQAFPGNSFVSPIPPNPNLEIENFVPNGQFLLHNDHVPVPYPNASTPSNFTYNTVPPYTVNVTPVAPGGWTFERTSTSTATDTITFHHFLSSPPNEPTGSPRYAIDITRSTPSNDTVVDLRIRWNDVNKFAGMEFTFLFTAQTLSGGTLSGIDIQLIKYYGTGGSPSAATDDLFSGPFSFTSTATQIAAVGTFPIASGTVGTNDDDFLQLAIRFPSGASSTFSVQLTDFMLFAGVQPVGTIFPNETNGEFVLQALSNIAPTTQIVPPLNGISQNYYSPDGSNLYLPMIMTTEGFTWDYSQLGTIVGKVTSLPVYNELLCDGSRFTAADYSNIGIPYKRLFNVLFNTTLNAPIFGTGSTFVNAYVSTGLTTVIILNQNAIGVQTNPADGATPTGFTFALNAVGNNPNIGYVAHANSTGVVTSVYTAAPVAVLNGATAGTSGFTVTDIFNSNLNGYRYAFRVVPIAATTLNSKYFTFASASVNYYIWFNVNGGGIDPAPGGTGIQLALLSTMSAADVGNMIANVLSRFQVNTITTIAAPPSSSYWTFFANTTDQYVVWYSLNGSAQPVAAGTPTYIKVAITGIETAAQIATLTQIAINSVFFAVPDLRGVFLRGADPTAIWDLDVAFRYGFLSNLPGINAGSFELNQFLSHIHATFSTATAGGATQGGTGGTGATQSTGGSEVRPINMFVNWFIKY